MTHRRVSFLLSAGLLAAALVGGWASEHRSVSRPALERMSAAMTRLDSLAASTRGAGDARSVSARAAIALGYAERLRLGLGSPFRLADFALHDPRLGEFSRHDVAWALLGRLARGEAYEIEPAVLDGIAPTSEPDGRDRNGAAHVALIERTIAAASDPRAGEMAIRIAYALAAAEGTVAPGTDAIAAQAAALVRDRRLAQEDLRDLVHDAAVDGLDPLDELLRRRARHDLRVEAPTATTPGIGLQVEAMQSVPAVLASIRDLARDAPASAAARPTGPASGDREPLLGPAAATRLADLGGVMPPESPVVVTMRTQERSLLAGDLAPEVRRARARLAARSRTEETLTGEYGRLRAVADTLESPGARAMLAAASALRAYAQETPWFPGDGGPTAADLESEFGLREIAFDADVPALWRPYYLRMLALSFRDAQRAVAGLTLDGLRVRFGMSALPDSALAMHDPNTRTLRLSVLTSAGTLAHELAHDLDWQAARRLYASGGYSTDHAMREQRGPLASSIRGLAAARLGGPRPRAGATGDRPAEVFARNVDWFVAVALAREGRSDGYLSAAQDAALTGYAAVSPAALSPAGARSLVDAMREMTYVGEPTRESFLAQWADPAAVDPYVLARRVLDTWPAWRVSPSSPGHDGAALEALEDAALEPAARCATASRDWTPETRSRLALLDLALDARALGIARQRARWRGGAARPAWARSVLGQAPWAPEEGERIVRRIRAALVAQLDAGPDDQLVPRVPSPFRPSAASCSSSSR